jgi:hypothetical protein
MLVSDHIDLRAPADRLAKLQERREQLAHASLYYLLKNYRLCDD